MSPRTGRYDFKNSQAMPIEIALLESARVNRISAHGWSPMSFRQQSLDLAKFEMAFSRSFGVGHLEFSQRIKDDLGDD